MRTFLLAFVITTALICLFSNMAHAYTCEDVRYAATHWTPAQIAAQKKQMTPAQRHQAEKCLRDAGEPTPLGW